MLHTLTPCFEVPIGLRETICIFFSRTRYELIQQTILFVVSRVFGDKIVTKEL
jgi:hypothetical protein